ncbi:hypothetical protein Tco_1144985 [Tanacetum coccineum]
MKFFGYSHLEEIMVRRQDDVLYKFREGDFKRLCRQDIEDMLLLLVQGKLTNLSLDDRYALNVALRIPDTTRPDLRKMTPYTGYPDVQGIIYQDELNRNRLMRTDELHKFYTLAGNPVKEILLKLNLPDHTSILTDSKVTPTKHGQITKPYSSPLFIANCFNAGYLKMVVKSLRRKTLHSQLVDQKFDSISAKSFSEDVCQLIFRIDKVNFDHPILNMLLDKVKSDVYMLGSGMLNVGLWCPKNSSIALTAFADADHAGCQDTRRSTSGSTYLLGDRLVSWSSKRQKSAAISSTEAEYIDLSGCYSRSKHIDIRFHFIKEHVENGVIELYFVNTEYQLADIFTKAIGRNRIEFLINKLGMRSFTPETLKQLADEVDE